MRHAWILAGGAAFVAIATVLCRANEPRVAGRHKLPRLVHPEPAADPAEERTPIHRSSASHEIGVALEERSAPTVEDVRLAAETEFSTEARTAAVKSLGYALFRTSSAAESLLIEQTLERRARFDVDPGVREIAAGILRSFATED